MRGPPPLFQDSSSSSPSPDSTQQRYGERRRTSTTSFSRQWHRKTRYYDASSPRPSSLARSSRSRSRTLYRDDLRGRTRSRSRRGSRSGSPSHFQYGTRSRYSTASRSPSRPRNQRRSDVPVFQDSPPSSRSRRRSNSTPPRYRETGRSPSHSPEPAKRGRGKGPPRFNEADYSPSPPGSEKCSGGRGPPKFDEADYSPTSSPEGKNRGKSSRRQRSNSNHGRHRSENASPRYRNRYRDESPSQEMRSRSVSRGRNSTRQTRRPQTPAYDHNPFPHKHDFAALRRKLLSKGGESRFPGGDKRWPAPGGEWNVPLCIVCEDQGQRKEIYYHLIHDNSAPKAREWLHGLNVMAAEAHSKLSADEVPIVTIMNALNSNTLRPVSEGKRGKIWILDERHENVWVSMKKITREKGAVKLMSDLETFEVFGLCLKDHQGDVLLISWKF